MAVQRLIQHEVMELNNPSLLSIDNEAYKNKCSFYSILQWGVWPNADRHLNSSTCSVLLGPLYILKTTVFLSSYFLSHPSLPPLPPRHRRPSFRLWLFQTLNNPPSPLLRLCHCLAPVTTAHFPSIFSSYWSTLCMYSSIIKEYYNSICKKAPRMEPLFLG